MADRFVLARDTVMQAGTALRECHLKKEEVGQKTGNRDLVTYYDRQTEQLLREAILSAFPTDTIIGEEYPAANSGAASVTWYIDPIDGTTNFINQHRNYAISVGCWDGPVPLFGLVLDVERQLLYWAKNGEGAWRNEEPIHVSRCQAVEDSLLTLPGLQATLLEEQPHREGVTRLARMTRGARGLGSVALELCEVACGEADLLATSQSCPWDHNAARVILAEAGGAVFTLDGEALPLGEKTTLLAMNRAERLGQVLEILQA